MWPENQVSRVPGEVEHQKNLFMFFTKKSGFKCFKLVYNLILCVLFLKQVLFWYLPRCGLRTKFPVSKEEYITLTSFLELYTVQFEFYSILSLHIAC